MSVKPSQSVTVQFTTRHPYSGAATNADSTPSGTLIKNGTDQGDTVTVTNVSTGVYKAAVTIPSGAAAGDLLALRIAATVASVADNAVIWHDLVDTKRLADLNDAAAAPSASAIRTEMDSNSSKLANLDATVSSRLASAGYTAPNNAAVADVQSRLPAALVGGRIDANVGAIDSHASAAVRLALSAGQMIPATVDTTTNGFTPTTTQFQADDVTEATADHYKGRLVLWTGGLLAGQVAQIEAYALVGGIGQFTVSTITGPPANNDTCIII
ncbi:MAG: hypothetical protein K8T25_15700 [Planctomycetia bacterium]|nr:hypothetical protein [Planctomycetia bacterium]